MVRKAFEADDPMELVGVVLPADVEAIRDMAYVFAEEFACMGCDARSIGRIFQNPFYAGAHQAYRALGEEAICTIIGECTQMWCRGRVTYQAPRGREGA